MAVPVGCGKLQSLGVTSDPPSGLRLVSEVMRACGGEVGVPPGASISLPPSR